jgi:hypothetical protein
LIARLVQLFQFPTNSDNLFASNSGLQKKMYVIRHDHIPANGPTMSIMSRAPFINQNFRDILTRENRLSMASARCYEINRRINPNAPKSPQMLVHFAVVAEGADLGNLAANYARPRSAPAATASALRGEYRFRISRADFSRGNPSKAADQRAKQK